MSDITSYSFREYTPEEKMIASLARKAAIEECARRLETEADEISDDDYTTDKETLRWAAQTIRALKDKY